MSTKVKFGVVLPSNTAHPFIKTLDFGKIQEIALECERLGYHSLWLDDHMMMAWPILECWTTLSALASVTKRIRLGTLVLCNSFRYPSVLAKMSATLDVISEGRLDLGIGAGWNESEHEAYGIPFHKYNVRIRQLDEGVEIIKRLWMESKVDFHGKYFILKGTTCEPKPKQTPHPPIMIGGLGKNLLKIVAKHADRSNFGSRIAVIEENKEIIEKFKERLKILEEYCSEIKRDFSEIEKSHRGYVLIRSNRRSLEKKMHEWYLLEKRVKSFEEWKRDVESKGFVGTPEECLKKIKQFVDIGVSLFIFSFIDLPETEGLRLFTEKVMHEI